MPPVQKSPPKTAAGGSGSGSSKSTKQNKNSPPQGKQPTVKTAANGGANGVVSTKSGKNGSGASACSSGGAIPKQKQPQPVATVSKQLSNMAICNPVTPCVNNPDKLNKELKKHLKEIIPKKITLDENEAKLNVKTVEDVLNAVVKAMRKEEPLFDEMYQNVVYTGSYYDGLRITHPREFDLNLVIRLPFESKDIELVQAKDAPAFMHVFLKRTVEEIFAYHPKWTPLLYQKLKNFFEEINGKNYLMRNKMQNWIQSIISRAIGQFEKPAGVEEIKRSQSGPAITWFIKTKRKITIDVDFVPVIVGSCLQDAGNATVPFPPGFSKSKRFTKLNKEAQVFYLVPKPTKGAAANSDQAGQYWRVSFPEAEKKLISGGMNAAKPLIKLFKLLRDCENWKTIASYYIKTMFLLEIDEHPSPDYWKEDDLGTLFVKMLEKMKKVISDRKLPYYFSRNYNILAGLDDKTARNIADRLDKIIKSITTEPETVWKYYGGNPAAS